MALVAMEIPKVGLVMEAVRVTRWLKNVGDAVTLGEPLVEVETEKSVVEIEATVSGRLVEILVQVGEEASVGDEIARLESATAQPSSTAAQKTRTVQPETALPSAAAFEEHAGDRIRSSPVARKLAAERGLDLGSIAGSGPRGRVQLEDVKRAIESPATARALQAPTSTTQGLAPMRRALARAMTLSNATVPQFFVERSVDWTTLQALRAELSAASLPGSSKLSVNDFLLQAVARTLIEYPALNATFAGDADSPGARLVHASGAHIGLVVAVENGLLVPVLHDVERLGLAAIARRRSECVERALKGRLKREELDGATFSLSNLGARGPDRFTAIINPPQSAILAVGRQRDCVVARVGQIEVRPLSDLTLTVDHRVADGRLASEFLARLVELLEGRDWRLE
ncbi:MAG TPA: dihydrolipoamide acetyltransferase family protein [Steroidobacteraceae bacterium]|nr:dihydrolipoamide acetyltransferase family protein [Steroidobacteraceae bacterium]